jgi:fructoselysine-6-P-deglycase FrlB-like protein
VDSPIEIEVDLRMHPLRPYGAGDPSTWSAPMTTTDWHDDTYPELRDAPPWVMQEMIEAAPSLVPILASDAIAEPAAAILAAARAGAPITVVGCGTSLHASWAIADLLADGLRRAGTPRVVEARDALEASLDPRTGGVALGVSHDGGTHATMLALQAARDAGARTALITHRAGGTTAGPAELVVPTPVGDRSWCHTIAYTSAILAGAALAEELAPRGLDADAVGARLAGLVEATAGPAEGAAAVLARGTSLVTTGSGSDRVTSRELGLKIEEGAHRPTAHRDLEILLHGHLVANGPQTPIVLIANDPSGRPRRLARARLLVDAAHELGAPVVGILDADAAAALSGQPALAAVVPTGAPTLPQPLDALLAGAIGLQRLTLALVHAVGTNPDLIRREQEPWRRAAAALDAGGW